MSWTKCFIGLGSNLGDSTVTLGAAVSAIKNDSNNRNIVLSSYYQSKPHGPQEQPDYINAVVGFETQFEAEPLLDFLQSIENQHGRVRTGERWGARTLDLDILLYGDQYINTKRLQVPHPWMRKREFVLYPLYELAPDLKFPGGGSLKKSLGSVSGKNLIRLASQP